jgi:L-threonylcarbamoyladenylate synthase
MERGADIDRAVAALRAGGVIGFPTETVYGLGADAASDAAVARVFAVKRRPPTHPLIVHLAAGAALDGWARTLSADARRLVMVAWPGPLTIVVARGPRVSTVATGGADTVALRVPAHPLAQALLAAFGGGIAAPSANRFGAVSPTTADHVAADLGDDLDYLLDGGACGVGVESTIVDFSRGRPALLRPGGMSREAIEAIVGRRLASGEGDAAAPAAPGTLASHYAPRAEVHAVAAGDVAAEIARLAAANARVGALVPAALAAAAAHATVTRALPDDVDGMARELYAALRELDAAGVDVIVAALPPAAGLGEAVGDRLRRAGGPRG